MGFGLRNINIEPVGNRKQYKHYYGPGGQDYYENGNNHYGSGHHHYEEHEHEHEEHEHDHEEHCDHNYDHHYYGLGLKTLGSGFGGGSFIMFLVLILLYFGTGYGVKR